MIIMTDHGIWTNTDCTVRIVFGQIEIFLHCPRSPAAAGITMPRFLAIAITPPALTSPFLSINTILCYNYYISSDYYSLYYGRSTLPEFVAPSPM
jgi:hypothetical protein